MNEWIDDLADSLATGEPAVLVTVAGVRGSAPREVGARMVVTPRETFGTIGGGQLEYQSTRIAVNYLGDDRNERQRFPLGSSMGQCCGGVVEILFEAISEAIPGWLRDLQALYRQRVPTMFVSHADRPEKLLVTATDVFGVNERQVVDKARSLLADGGEAQWDGDVFYAPVTGTDFNIAVFGAGHVGSAVVTTLAPLEANIRWVDSRHGLQRKVPGNVRAIESAEPALEVMAMPAGSYYLVMTHSHAIDFAVCDRILRRGDARYCGLIGSRTKRRRFEARFRKLGLQEHLLETLTCPIGVGGISGKKPAEIAVAVAAEVLRRRELAEQRHADGAADNVRPLRG